MQNKNFLVIGGTGKTGRRVANQLTQQGFGVRIGSRSSTRPFDWHQPDNWAAALEGMHGVYITYQPDLAVPGAYEAIIRLIEEAQKANIQKLVILSGKGEPEAQRCEHLILNCGIDATVVRASWFNQNFSESFFLDPILAGHVALPKANVDIPFVDADDIAAVAVEALTKEGHNGNIYEVTGPRTLTFKDVTREIAEATQRDIKFHEVSLEEYLQSLRDYGVPQEFVNLIEYLFTTILTPENSIVTSDVERVLNRKPKDFTEFARQTANAGIWNA